MLVLSRKREEKLQIGHDITVTILKVKGNSVQIGIEAPKSVRVLRTELVLPSGAGERTAHDDGDQGETREASAPADDVPRRTSATRAAGGGLRKMVERVLVQSV
jgi:carbon storage regulator CsrA